jgi:ABC-2 type transport system permease protein
MRPWEINLGLNLGGAVRALLIGAGLLAVAVPLTGVPVREPLVLIVAVLLALLLFCTLGTVVGIFAEGWDHTTFIQNIVILPLTFLGGVFYSIDTLPSPWEELSHANPLFYLVSAVRYGFLGESEVPIGLSLAVTALFALVCTAWSTWLFATGRKLKP